VERRSVGSLIGVHSGCRGDTSDTPLSSGASSPVEIAPIERISSHDTAATSDTEKVLNTKNGNNISAVIRARVVEKRDDRIENRIKK